MNPGPSWEDFRHLRFSAGGYWLTREVSQRVGAALAYAAYRLGVSPAALTWVGLACNFAGSVVFAFAPATTVAAVGALLLYQLAYAFDCADGQLARGAGRASAFGAWLDLALDYARCVLIASAVLVALSRLHGVGVEAAVLATAPLLTGMVVSAHTGMALRGVPASGSPRGRSTLGSIARLAVDTPAVLVLLCLLRPWGAGLAAYAVAMGLLECAIAGIAAHRRLGAR